MREMEEGWEGCLSVPGMRGLVPRYRRLRYQGFDASRRGHRPHRGGFHARVVQHECDHLDGILYPMRIRDMRNFGFTEELFPGAGSPATTDACPTGSDSAAVPAARFRNARWSSDC